MIEPTRAQRWAVQRRRARTLERGFRWLCVSAALVPVALLAILLIDVGAAGLARLDLAFLTGPAADEPAQAGLWPALIGSASLVSLTAAIALPVGVGAAIYLEEYGGGRPLDRVISSNVANLAAVPSILYGLVGLELFARVLGLGYGLLAGSLTMALVILPLVIISAREALRCVPQSLREGGLALGASRWQVVRHVVLPVAWPGMFSGMIAAVTRAVGEAAPVLLLAPLVLGAVAPEQVDGSVTVLPVQIFHWVAAPGHAFASNAAAGIVVLLAVLVVLNLLALGTRARAARLQLQGGGR